MVTRGSSSGKTKAVAVVNEISAGIDVGSREHYVAVGKDRADNPVRRFGCYTPDLEEMATWLLECGVSTVAMESTGVYWIPVYQVLRSRGLDVSLVDARSVKNVPGRKSDVSDCQWLQQLHTFGLLRGCFLPDEEIAPLREYIRHRGSLIESQSREILHLQNFGSYDELCQLMALAYTESKAIYMQLAQQQAMQLAGGPIPPAQAAIPPQGLNPEQGPAREDVQQGMSDMRMSFGQGMPATPMMQGRAPVVQVAMV